MRRPLDSPTVWQKDGSFASHVQPRKASHFKQEMKKIQWYCEEHDELRIKMYIAVLNVAVRDHTWVVAHVVSWLKARLLAIGRALNKR